MSSSPVSDPEPLPGWQLIQFVGHWHGKAYRARRELDDLEAILEFLTLDDEKSTRLLTALGTVQDARHPHILGILFIERMPEGVVVATPVVDYRQSLSELARACPRGALAVAPRELWQYMEMAADGIDFLGSQCNCPHKNVKSENLLLLGESLKVTRYGYPDAIDLGGACGAQGYMSPERSGGGEATSQSDQFALAITYVELRTGRNPLIPNRFKGIFGLEELDLSALPEQEQSVVSRALRAKPEQRWASCRGFVNNLASVSGRTRRRCGSDRDVTY